MSTIEHAVMQAIATAHSLKHGEKGQGMAEYGLILALVAVVVIGALTAIGTGIGGTLNTISAKL